LTVYNIIFCSDILGYFLYFEGKLHNEELHNLYSSPSIIRMIKSRRMRWSGHVAQMGEKRHAYTILVGKTTKKETTRQTKMQVGG
jgi:hypothetical protein